MGPRGNVLAPHALGDRLNPQYSLSSPKKKVRKKKNHKAKPIGRVAHGEK